jgi:predicted metal-dependent phosphoesterase TrpH
MIVDLHVHTRLSADSNVTAEQYLELARGSGSGLGAICFTEHRLYPADGEIARGYAELSDKFAVRIFRGIEADTDLGHLIVLGITHEVMRRFDLTARLLKSDHLIEVVHGEGGIAIPAHPFRDSGFGSRLDALLARHGAALSAIEVLNGQNSEDQNTRAEDAALKLGMTALGGSDAHFATPRWFLTCATELEREVATVEQLCNELRAGRARPYRFAAAPEADV